VAEVKPSPLGSNTVIPAPVAGSYISPGVCPLTLLKAKIKSRVRKEKLFVIANFVFMQVVFCKEVFGDKSKK
jgi:hypothetical protein